MSSSSLRIRAPILTGPLPALVVPLKNVIPIQFALTVVSMFTRNGGTVYDITAGTGAFGMACALLSRNYVGFENESVIGTAAATRLRLFINDLDKNLKKALQEWVGSTIF